MSGSKSLAGVRPILVNQHTSFVIATADMAFAQPEWNTKGVIIVDHCRIGTTAPARLDRVDGRDHPLTTPYPTHAAARLDVHWRASAALQSVAEPHRPALQYLTAFERHSAERGWCAGRILAGVEDARRPLCAVHGRENR